MLRFRYVKYRYVVSGCFRYSSFALITVLRTFTNAIAVKLYQCFFFFFFFFVFA